MTRYSYNTAVAIYSAGKAKKRQDIFRNIVYIIGRISAILAVILYTVGALSMDSPSIDMPMILMGIGSVATVISISLIRISCRDI